MFGCLFQMRYLNKNLKLFDFVGKVLHTDISDGIPCLLYFVDLALVLRARQFRSSIDDVAVRLAL